jgi:hypothetical protein
MVRINQVSGLKHHTLKAPNGALKLEVFGIDDVDARIRAIGEIELGAIRIDPADVKRHERVAGRLSASYGDCGHALGLGIGRCPWAGTSGKCGAGRNKRQRDDKERERLCPGDLRDSVSRAKNVGMGVT